MFRVCPGFEFLAAPTHGYIIEIAHKYFKYHDYTSRTVRSLNTAHINLLLTTGLHTALRRVVVQIISQSVISTVVEHIPTNMIRRPPFSHHPLPKDSIRLLNIVQIEPEVFCRLETFSLSNSPAYEAISYCWGKQTPTETFICNNASYSVTPHLHEGLRCLFTTFNPTWIWIDAICIHQCDDSEKSSQVSQMHRIF